MMLFRLIAAAGLLLLGFAAAGIDAAAAKTEASFRRGINITHLFNFPQPGWPPFRGERATVSDGELTRLAELGFDFIRLPVDPTPFIDAGAERRRALAADIAAFVKRANAAGLAVMVTGYTIDGDRAWRPERPKAEGGQDFDDYAHWLEMIAVAVAAAAPRGAAIELMNEPQASCVATDTTDWSVYQLRLHGRLRALVDLPLVITGGCWSRIDGLMRLALLPDDPNTLFDVHYYAPFSYTHQGATWATPILAYVGGLRFPPMVTDRTEAVTAVETLIAERHRGIEDTAAEKRAEALREVDTYLASGYGPERIGEDFLRLARWAKRHRIDPQRIVIGEFGAIRARFATDPASRARYLAAVRQAVERHGFGWAMWEYFGRFGLLGDDTTRKLSPTTVEALGLGASRPSNAGRSGTTRQR